MAEKCIGRPSASNDKKTIFVTTNDHSGVEVIDIATRKVTMTGRYRLICPAVTGGSPGGCPGLRAEFSA